MRPRVVAGVGKVLGLTTSPRTTGNARLHLPCCLPVAHCIARTHSGPAARAYFASTASSGAESTLPSSSGPGHTSSENSILQESSRPASTNSSPGVYTLRTKKEDAVVLIVPFSATFSDVLQGIASTAPIGPVVRIISIAGPLPKSDPPASRMVGLILRINGSGQELIARAGAAGSLRINGVPVLAHEWPPFRREPPTGPRLEPIPGRLSRVVLVCAPRGRLPREQDIRQRLPAYLEPCGAAGLDMASVQGYETETSPVLVYKVGRGNSAAAAAARGGGAGAVEVMEWRFLANRVARHFALCMRLDEATQPFRDEGVFVCYGVDPCWGAAAAPLNRQLALDALTDESKRLPLERPPTPEVAPKGLLPEIKKALVRLRETTA